MWWSSKNIPTVFDWSDSGHPDLCRTLPLTFPSSSYLQTGGQESSVQSEGSFSVTCQWRTDPGWQLCSCRENLEVQLLGNRASPRGHSPLRAPKILPRLLHNRPPPPLLQPPSHRGWCSAWQHQWAPADGGNKEPKNDCSNQSDLSWDTSRTHKGLPVHFLSSLSSTAPRQQFKTEKKQSLIMLGCSSLSGVITLNAKSCVSHIIAILEHIKVMSDHRGDLLMKAAVQWKTASLGAV